MSIDKPTKAGKIYYLIFNYRGETGNDKTFPLYGSVFSVDREGTKLAEIFKLRDRIDPDIIYANHPEIIDHEIETEWRSEGKQSPDEMLILEFREPISISGLSLLPGSDEREYAQSPEVSISEDGEIWTDLPLTVSGLYNLTFPQAETRRLRIRNSEPADVHWSVREIYFF